MNLLKVNFRELYERHLCRHSQYGINVAHLVCVVGIYWALCGVVYELTESAWPLVGAVAIYWLLIAGHVPLVVFISDVLVLALCFGAVAQLPSIPWWLYVIAIPILYKLQSWSHKIYTNEKDMTEFNKKYPKGLSLFVLLAIYELPLLLHYLCLGRKDWVFSMTSTVGTGQEYS